MSESTNSGGHWILVRSDNNQRVGAQHYPSIEEALADIPNVKKSILESSGQDVRIKAVQRLNG